jgi:hypothetical protein
MAMQSGAYLAAPMPGEAGSAAFFLKIKCDHFSRKGTDALGAFKSNKRVPYWHCNKFN